MVEKSGRRGVVAQCRGRLEKDRYGWITSDSVENWLLSALEGRRRCDGNSGGRWEGCKGCCQYQEPSKGTAGASEAKLQAKAQITAAVGSNYVARAHRLEAAAGCEMAYHTKYLVPQDADESGKWQVDLHYLSY